MSRDPASPVGDGRVVGRRTRKPRTRGGAPQPPFGASSAAEDEKPLFRHLMDEVDYSKIGGIIITGALGPGRDKRRPKAERDKV